MNDPVKVRDLVWQDVDDDDCDFEASGSGLRYWLVGPESEVAAYRSIFSLGVFPTFDAAKAAAQADYAARIIAALDLTAVEAMQAENKRLREALEELARDPRDESVCVGDGWSFYTDAINYARAALKEADNARLVEAEDGA